MFACERLVKCGNEIIYGLYLSINICNLQRQRCLLPCYGRLEEPREYNRSLEAYHPVTLLHQWWSFLEYTQIQAYYWYGVALNLSVSSDLVEEIRQLGAPCSWKSLQI